MLAAAVLLGGCAGSSSMSGAPSPEPSDRCGLDFLDQPAEVVSEPEVAEASEAVSNLALDVSSASNEPVRVTVRFDEKLALDVRTPAVPEVCAHQPVYSHEFRLSGDEVKVVVTTDRNQHRSITVPLGGRKQWVVVQPQDGFPLGLRSYGQEVSWG
jgi:hypothetical protein